MNQSAKNKSPFRSPFDNDLFATVFEELYEPLCRFCMTFIHQKDTAEDIVQEQFVYLWENWSRLSEIEAIKSYLYTSVRNKSLSYLVVP
ncbi:MAG: hypothetical protein JXA77_04725 [Bacteroidales bacterium]|nr:hypothetical protein [Bacteroidales bacterium]MBN2820116.1 hypothetical protein [Bacteroidales bacterium]